MHYIDQGKRRNLAIITSPYAEAKDSVLDECLLNFLQLLQPLSEDIFVITGVHPIDDKGVYVLNVRMDNKKQSALIRAFKFIYVQIKISTKLSRILNKIDIVISFVAGPLILPVLVARLLRKKVSICVTGLSSKPAEHDYSGKTGYIFPKALKLLEFACFTLADQITVESESVIRFANLSRYRKKISICGALYIDTVLFSLKSNLMQRESKIGYVGRISSAKGIMNFIKAMPLILKERSDSNFLLIGDGELLDEVRSEIKREGLKNKVTFASWIPRDELPDYYNQLKLLVFPSYSEGLPGVVQEAMACGTPVVATPVGGVPDLIKDGKTGFIMENNSPECIARNVIRALEHPRLDEIAQNARKLIECEYAYEVMVEKCKIALDQLMKD